MTPKQAAIVTVIVLCGCGARSQDAAIPPPAEHPQDASAAASAADAADAAADAYDQSADAAADAAADSPMDALPPPSPSAIEDTPDTESTGEDERGKKDGSTPGSAP